MTITARFKLDSLTPCSSDSVRAHFHAHTGKGSEDFQKYTPWGELSMGITVGSNALKQLEIGKVYELSFNEVDIAEPLSAVVGA